MLSELAKYNMDSKVFRALANDKRLLILEWLRQPRRHFRAQLDGDLVDDGVCGVLIAEKLGVSQPTASEHLRILLDAGLIEGKKVRQWIFYKRCAKGLAAARKQIEAVL
jgi:DNA-binding transcriptional ArsR family regulator